MVSLMIIAIHTGNVSHVVTPWIKKFTIKCLKTGLKIWKFSKSGRALRRPSRTFPGSLPRRPAGPLSPGVARTLYSKVGSRIFCIAFDASQVKKLIEAIIVAYCISANIWYLNWAVSISFMCWLVTPFVIILCNYLVLESYLSYFLEQCHK